MLRRKEDKSTQTVQESAPCARQTEITMSCIKSMHAKGRFDKMIEIGTRAVATCEGCDPWVARVMWLLAVAHHNLGAHQVASQWTKRIQTCSDPWMAATARMLSSYISLSIGKSHSVKTEMRRAVAEMKDLISRSVPCSNLQGKESLSLTFASALLLFGRVLLLTDKDVPRAIDQLEFSISVCAHVTHNATTLFEDVTCAEVINKAYVSLMGALLMTQRLADARLCAKQWTALTGTTHGENGVEMLQPLEHLTAILLLLAKSASDATTTDMLAQEAGQCLMRRCTIITGSDQLSLFDRAFKRMCIAQDTAEMCGIRNDVVGAEMSYLSVLQPPSVLLLDLEPCGRNGVGETHQRLGNLLLMKMQPSQPGRAAVHLQEALVRCQREEGRQHLLTFPDLLHSLGLCFQQTGDLDLALHYAERWEKHCVDVSCADAAEAHKLVANITLMRTARHLPPAPPAPPAAAVISSPWTGPDDPWLD